LAFYQPLKEGKKMETQEQETNGTTYEVKFDCPEKLLKKIGFIMATTGKSFEDVVGRAINKGLMPDDEPKVKKTYKKRQSKKEQPVKGE
jgi:hypothetical protein